MARDEELSFAGAKCARRIPSAVLGLHLRNRQCGAYRFHILAESAPRALREFAAHAHVQLLYDYKVFIGLETPAVQGRMEAPAALALLLKRSGFKFQRVNGRTIAIMPATSPPEGPAGRGATQRKSRINAPDPADTARDTISLAGPSIRLQEVLVTARKARENLQDTPVSVTAFTASDIAYRGMNAVLAVAQATPNLTIMSGNNYSGKSALTYIRGVGQDQFTYEFQPGVGYYVDGVYYGPVYGSIFQLGDISNIQVLRGTQGTLFGTEKEYRRAIARTRGAPVCRGAVCAQSGRGSAVLPGRTFGAPIETS